MQLRAVAPAYGFHVHHGRTLPIASGIKLANRDLTVLAPDGGAVLRILDEEHSP